RSDPYTWSRRLSVVRPFARYLSGVDSRTEIPSTRIFGPAHRRVPPRVLKTEEVTRFVAEAARLFPDKGLRPRTFSTLFGLLACTGLRVSEAIRLQIRDVDLVEGLLRIRKSKFRKSRLVPLHPSAVKALSSYARKRDEVIPSGSHTDFFMLENGVPVTYSRTRTALHGVRRKLGWDQVSTKTRPNLRSLRHTFACHRLVAWYEQGVDVNERIHTLSTYLGHGKVTDTYWYLSGIPQLLAIAGSRFQGLSGRGGVEPCRK
ncbi:MAG: tyrosine-type recombinase/integrase, partial [Candidatus Eisenbacteria bacterium]|nr:tyrosine-type recombinase/integrase [Candidatus Eisenbacteria bacterium]